MKVLYFREKFAPLKDFQRLQRVLRARHSLIKRRDLAKNEMQNIEQMIIKIKLPKSIALVRKTIGGSNSMKVYGELCTVKNCSLAIPCHWTVTYTPSEIKEVYPGFATNYYRALMQSNALNEKIRLIDKFLTSGKCIKYST